MTKQTLSPALQQLRNRIDALRAEAGNFMRHSWKAMYQFDRDADRLEAEFTDRLAREVEASSSRPQRSSTPSPWAPA